MVGGEGEGGGEEGREEGVAKETRGKVGRRPLIVPLPSLSANRVRKLSHRDNYGFHGFYFLLLFVYKYFVDTSFIFISCTSVDGESVSPQAMTFSSGN